jgi:hypothetical protein
MERTMALIDSYLPSPRIRQVDRVEVAAAPATAWAHVRNVDFYTIPSVRRLFALRLLPSRIGAVFTGKRPDALPATMRIGDIVAPGTGFHLLEEEPGREVVVGAIGKFWQPSIDFAPATPEGFAAFARGGFGKVAWALRVDPARAGGSWIGVDLRVTATDDEAWTKFRPYWSAIGPFSHWIRRAALRLLSVKLGAPAREATRTLPGDDLLPRATASRTDSVTIEAPPSRVWPWLAQMGCRRAGWYSYDRLDNGGAPSVDRIVPELQHLAVGDVLPATPKGESGFVVRAIDPERSLVLSGPPDSEYGMTWSFTLDPIGDGATRLIVRVRAEDMRSVAGLRLAAIAPIHYVMEREQLRNVKRRAETKPASAA